MSRKSKLVFIPGENVRPEKRKNDDFFDRHFDEVEPGNVRPLDGRAFVHDLGLDELDHLRVEMFQLLVGDDRLGRGLEVRFVIGVLRGNRRFERSGHAVRTRNAQSLFDRAVRRAGDLAAAAFLISWNKTIEKTFMFYYFI